MKKLISTILAIMVCTSSAVVMAADEIGVILNGKKLEFDQNPVIVNDRTLVPFRGILEAMGASVEWDGDTKTVTATKEDITLKMTIDSNTIYKNGEAIVLDVAPTIVNDRTMVPARAVSESFDAKVNWDGVTRTVIISTDNVIYEALEKLNSSKNVYMLQNVEYVYNGQKEENITIAGIDKENKLVYNSIVVNINGKKVHENTFIANPTKGYSLQNGEKKEYTYSDETTLNDYKLMDDTNYYEFLEETDSDIIYRLNGGIEKLYINKETGYIYKLVTEQAELEKISNGETYENDAVTEVIYDTSYIMDRWNELSK